MEINLVNGTFRYHTREMFGAKRCTRKGHRKGEPDL